MTDPGDLDILDLGLRLLDRQVVDRDGRMVGKVDDLELHRQPDGSLLVAAILTGPLALGPRLGGRLGRWTTAIARRLSPDTAPKARRIGLGLAVEIGSAIRLSVGSDQLGIAPLERWADSYVVSRIPGSEHAG